LYKCPLPEDTFQHHQMLMAAVRLVDATADVPEPRVNAVGLDGNGVAPVGVGGVVQGAPLIVGVVLAVPGGTALVDPVGGVVVPHPGAGVVASGIERGGDVLVREGPEGNDRDEAAKGRTKRLGNGGGARIGLGWGGEGGRDVSGAWSGRGDGSPPPHRMGNMEQMPASTRVMPHAAWNPWHAHQPLDSREPGPC
jgi:hypothetical protein